jgi:hypothetical protein
MSSGEERHPSRSCSAPGGLFSRKEGPGVGSGKLYERTFAGRPGVWRCGRSVLWSVHRYSREGNDMKTILTVALLAVLAVCVTAETRRFISGMGSGSSTDPAEAVAKATADAQTSLYNLCADGKLTGVSIHVSTTHSGDWTFATVNAFATCVCHDCNEY